MTKSREQLLVSIYTWMSKRSTTSKMYVVENILVDGVIKLLNTGQDKCTIIGWLNKKAHTLGPDVSEGAKEVAELLEEME